MTHARARRLAIALWIAMAVVVWNGLYDLRITLGVRDYLMKQALHDAGRGPAVTIAEAMAATSERRSDGGVALGGDHPRRRPGDVTVLVQRAGLRGIGMRRASTSTSGLLRTRLARGQLRTWPAVARCTSST